ncbi:aspartic peptidase domain-containing protein [Mycena alexandri]|uniref:Aspartic peptidase domain-containing protein n=1 Tax=Mycena alexandri TaxID=1745969 RepID=A0AAD6WXV6_9AGAR|nr:aspartic peptidase domain-containing protein [Mycena alexandri]
MLLKLPVSLLTFVLLGDFSCALRLNFEGRRVPVDRRGLYRRGSLSGSSPLDNSADLQYLTNITVGGVPFEVMIDTGSSDLWVAGTVSSSTGTGKAATISYASGGASGPVQLAAVEFDQFTVPNQAFIQVPPDSAHPVGQGLIGLGPSEGSVVFDAFDAADEGNTVLDNIFTQDTSTPNYITFLLGRLNDPSETFPGDLTVGEVMPNYTNITSQPKLPVTVVSVSNQANQHFQILLDADGFIGPDGSSIPITSVVSSTKNKKQATVVIDTGFSLPQVSASIAKAIYSQFSDAELVNDPDVGQIWFVPCTQEVNVTLKFGGNAFPVHPLDATIDPTIFGLTARKTASGQNACLGLFQPVSFDTGSNPSYDIIFGMAFLRNVYTLIDFGDFVADSKGKADPYIQFLSITDPADAHSDFVKSRLGGVDTTTDVLTHSAGSSDDSTKSKTTYYIIAGCVLGGILILLLLAFIVKRSRSRQRGVYRPLHLPAPGAGGPPPPMYQQNPMYAQQPYNGAGYNPDRPYDPPQERVPYHNPWEGRRQ